jgi:hypothetical protein
LGDFFWDSAVALSLCAVGPSLGPSKVMVQQGKINLIVTVGMMGMMYGLRCEKRLQKGELDVNIFV